MGKQSVQAKEVYLQAARTWKKLFALKHYWSNDPLGQHRSQALSSYYPLGEGDGKMKDPGNEVAIRLNYQPLFRKGARASSPES